MSSQREREAVLLGLDLAFGVSSSSSSTAAKAKAQAQAQAKAKAAGAGAGAIGNAPSALTEDEGLLYADLPPAVVQEMEGQVCMDGIMCVCHMRRPCHHPPSI